MASASASASGLSKVQTILVTNLSSTTLLSSSNQRSSSSQISSNLPTSSEQSGGVIIITDISTPGLSSLFSLSAGVAAGIAVGATMIVVLAAIGEFLLWRLRNLAENTKTALPER